jgi:DNA-binding transcriptional LysR family regulator
MNFRQIEAFRHVMQCGTTMGAASRLYISQPAISRLITALEVVVGFKLFNRHKGRLQPTAEGIRFYNAVEQNFLGLERLENAAEIIASEESQELSIACLPALSATLLPVAVKSFHTKHPDVLISIDTATVSQTLERLQSHRVEMAMTLAFPIIAGIEVEPLIETEIYCAIPIGHSLSMKKAIKATDLAGERVIKTLPAGPIKWEQDRQVFADAGVQIKHTIAYHTSHTGYAMIAQGLGIGLMEPFAYQHWHESVVLRPFLPRIPISYVIAYPTAMVRSQLVLAFRQAITKTAHHWQFPECC